MAKGFNFNKIERKYLPVTLKDGRTVTIKMPQKQTFEKIGIMQRMETTDAIKALQELDGFLSETISNNTESIDISPEYIAEQFDFEERMAFLEAYMDFVSEAQSDPN